MFVMLIRIGSGGGRGLCAARGLAGCEADVCSGAGALTHPARIACARAAIKTVKFIFVLTRKLPKLCSQIGLIFVGTMRPSSETHGYSPRRNLDQREDLNQARAWRFQFKSEKKMAERGCGMPDQDALQA